MGHLPSHQLINWVKQYLVGETLKLFPLPLCGECLHPCHAIIPALHTVYHLALLFVSFLFSHSLNLLCV